MINVRFNFILNYTQIPREFPKWVISVTELLFLAVINVCLFAKRKSLQWYKRTVFSKTNN